MIISGQFIRVIVRDIFVYIVLENTNSHKKKSVGGHDIHRLIKEVITVSANNLLADIHRVGDQRTALRHKSQINMNSVANPIGRI